MDERLSIQPTSQHTQPSPFTATIASLGLSPRQSRIVELVLEGKKDETIAFELGLSKHTVRDYLNKRIFPRLQVGNRVALIIKVATLRCQTCPDRQRPQ